MSAQIIKIPGLWADLGDQIEIVMERYPDLSSYGWRFESRGAWNCGETFKELREQMRTEDFARQVAACLEVMATQQPRGYALRIGKTGSYSLKHQVEERIRVFKQSEHAAYIGNGALITAAIIDGWVPVRANNSPNCGFKRGAKR